MTVSLTNLFFRVLNFGIIVGIVVYLYQRFGKKALQSMMREREEHEQALRDEAKKLGKRAKELEQAQLVQQELCVTLARTIEHWGMVVAQDYALRQEEKMRITQALHEKAEIVKRYIAWLEVRKACVQGAINDATAELVAMYTSPEAARGYLQKVLVTMQQERS